MREGRQKEHRDECEGGGNRSAAGLPAYPRWLDVERIDMVLPFCCARCVAAEVRRVRKRAMKEDAES